MITGINHITISVSDAATSIHFYQQILGCELVASWPMGAYLTAGPIWLALFQEDRVRQGPLEEYSHIAFSVSAEDLATMRSRFQENNVTIWQDNKTEGDSLYFLDPDGHKLELHVTELKNRLDHARQNPWPGLELHIRKERKNHV